jgi:renalase
MKRSTDGEAARMTQTVDVAVIGAGMAGLVCAQRLQQKGFSVITVEKSRGLGGRAATRRLEDGWADHGLRCLESQGPLTATLISRLLAQGLVRVWTDTIDEARSPDADQQSDTYPAIYPGADRHPRYIAAHGINTIAKTLGSRLEIWRSQRVEAIGPTPEQTWSLSLVSSDAEPRSALQARAIVMAIPAPQALPLLQPLVDQGLSPALVQAVQSVEFAPCVTAIATYSQSRLTKLPSCRALRFPESDSIDWVSLETTKQPDADRPIFVIQSTAMFANRHLEATDLTAVGQELLANIAEAIALPWLQSPEMLQVHRWRYALATRPISASYLMDLRPLPLACCGDWCGGNRIEDALRSGLAAAQHLQALLSAAGQTTADPADFAELLQAL